MSNVKISELTTGTTLSGSEYVPIVQNGQTVKTTAQAIAALGGGGGGGGIVDLNGYQFNVEGVILPFTLNSNYRIYVDFEIASYINDMCVVGNTGGSSFIFHLTEYSNKWYYSPVGGQEANFGDGSMTTGRHTFDYNNNGKAYFDNVEINNVSPNTDGNVKYTIGFRNCTDFTGKIHRLFIYDNVNDDYICDIKAYDFNGAKCLLDVVNNVIYTARKR